jgi:phosphohistidine swiveling domain-containing protein
VTFVLALGNAHGEQAWRCGAKACTLSRLLSAGFPVPGGFVVTTDALERTLQHCELTEEVADLLSRLEQAGPGEIGKLSAKLRATVKSATLTAELTAEVTSACTLLDGRDLAVRSSSSLEDRADISFAGQHDSLLNVRGPAACCDAIRDVWASLYSERALTYLRALKMSVRQEQMAVLIQEMVPASFAGVGFTVDPLSGDADKLVLHAVAGLGEACVSGSVASDEITLSRQGPAVTARQSTGEAEELTEKRAVAVASLLLRLEATLAAGPLDVEWACVEDDVYIVQARPMVQVSGDPGIRWESPVPGAHWRRRWRLGEWLSEPVTPLFATWALPRLSSSREHFGTGRLGWRHVPSFSMPSPWFCIVNGYFYTRQDLPAEIKAGLPFDARLKRMLQLRDFLKHWSRHDLPAYLKRFEQHQAFDFESASRRQLMDLIDVLIDEAGEFWYVLAPLGYGFERLIFKPHYERLLRQEERPHSSVLFRGYPNRGLDAQQRLYELALRIRSDEATRTLFADAVQRHEPARLPTWLHQEIAIYNRDFGHQVTSLDFYHPTVGESPEETLAALAALVRHDVDEPRARLARSCQQRERAEAEVLALLQDAGQEGADLAELMGCLQTNASVRENAIFYFQLGWPLLRRAVLALASALVDEGVLERPEQIFFLEYDELAGEIAACERRETPTSLATVASGRYETWQARCGLRPAETIPRGTANPQVRRRCGFMDDEDGARLVGQGVCAGRHRGRVRLIEDLTQPLAKGEVLVTSSASPALTPLMLLAGALVVDVGGGASHSSLVARELGLPTVVNTLDATRRLRDGQLVEVDGGEGTVRLLERV